MKFDAAKLLKKIQSKQIFRKLLRAKAGKTNQYF